MAGALALAGCGALAACGAEGDLVAGEQGRIARITDGDTLGLDTGLKVRLAEIEAPAPGYDGREDQPFAVEARSLLAAAATGRQGRLWYGGLTRDSYGRAIAHVIARDETGGEVWLNGYLARQGAARVRTYPDNAKRARRLLAFEAEARTAKRGLWGQAHWRVRGCDDLGEAPGFAIVEGALLGMEDTGEASAQLSARGVVLTGVAKLGRADVELRAGGRVRVRGRIDTRAEPAIRLTHWAQVEAG
jgi:endonuclease YncB( thermonuclease family)